MGRAQSVNNKNNCYPTHNLPPLYPSRMGFFPSSEPSTLDATPLTCQLFILFVVAWSTISLCSCSHPLTFESRVGATFPSAPALDSRPSSLDLELPSPLLRPSTLDLRLSTWSFFGAWDL